MTRLLLPVLALLTLSGCKTSEQVAMQAGAAHDAQCQSFGYAPGTDGYAQCRMQLYQTSAAVASNDYAARQAAWTAASQAQAAESARRRQEQQQLLQNANTSTWKPYQPPQTITCDSRGYMNGVRTECR
ncbi:hypothetical protein IZ6_28890 [Terrihabitans soli]|uniref:Lipoprotein n=1 Tax=Terrihabitans soli TaxID=708113 RepID=A0A6S6QNQ0_9HYPH|nr:hypothetical protein [Terrihabitans soli]BCJ92154.1 hypothetical protein IZ6_28890 [Terrihabitans soli]